jgi:hypothetical protein
VNETAINIYQLGAKIMNTQAKAIPTQSILSILDMVDRYNDLASQLSFVDALIKEKDLLRRLLSEHADTLGTGMIKVLGHTSYISFSPAPQMRTINNVDGYLEAVGLDSFLASARRSD